jgi:hypothetical protein
MNQQKLDINSGSFKSRNMYCDEKEGSVASTNLLIR